MGPRLFSRGKRACRRGESSDRRASMGPRLFSRGKKDNTGTKLLGGTGLQWGRDCSAAESNLAVVAGFPPHDGFNGAATVQPRKDALQSPIPRQTFRASMGPRLFSRGKGQAKLNTIMAIRLQWGRDCSAAERIAS